MGNKSKVTRKRVEAESKPVAVLLTTEVGEATIVVPPVNRWKASALHALNKGDSIAWATTTLSKDDLAAWTELDPTLDELGTFLEAWTDKSQVDLGESQASSDS